MSLDTCGPIQEFLDSLEGAIIDNFTVLKWTTDPAFRIKTSKGDFILHSNDIGVFIDDISHTRTGYHDVDEFYKD